MSNCANAFSSYRNFRPIPIGMKGEATRISSCVTFLIITSSSTSAYDHMSYARKTERVKERQKRKERGRRREWEGKRRDSPLHGRLIGLQLEVRIECDLVGQLHVAKILEHAGHLVHGDHLGWAAIEAGQQEACVSRAFAVRAQSHIVCFDWLLLLLLLILLGIHFTFSFPLFPYSI